MIRVIFTITFLLLFLTIPSSLFARNLNNNISSSSSTIENVDYPLAFPGLLPDSPFYFLKTARDKIVSVFIADPLKKAEFNLLTADKRLNMAVYLLDREKSKEELAISTISKGENYFEEAIVEIRKAEAQGFKTENIQQRLFLSANKHLDVLESLEKKVSSHGRKDIQKLKERMMKYEKDVNSLR